ncbi:MAG: hypothetical protein JRI54_02540 [Deltaproteobacteria bacterium]|nr:hypothetical protein [Deltaproteobacteria bacterium]
MSFLSAKSIQDRSHQIFDPAFVPDEKAWQPSSVELRLGGEAFLSGEKELVILGAEKPDIKIKPGNFAILLTKEKVKIPTNLMGFISIKSKYKWSGLVNISGFHVDPGWEGHLTFSVYNAGPSEIILRKDEKIFVIFFAKLDKETELYKGGNQYQRHISSEIMNRVMGKSVSPFELEDRLKSLETNVRFQWGLLISAVVGIILLFLRYLIKGIS